MLTFHAIALTKEIAYGLADTTSNGLSLAGLFV
jgi:hypothetical protein